MSRLLACVLVALALGARGAETLQHRNNYAQAYGETKGVVAVDAGKDLPRYSAVEPADALRTWKVKPGFKLELAAHEPQVRDPVAICFDENGRMFVCEMIDYSERRDVTPHLGRISMLEDTDGDGVYEKSTVFADNLPWPTGLIWANGGLFVGATPDIWRLEDKDGDGRAELRERVFTGFGTGLRLLNVQALMNSFQWGQDNRIHVQSGSGNRGKIKNLRRPEMPEEELGARDFWFDPRTYEFGFEAGGAQYGMSFDNYGRKFGCSNSDHLQFWVYDDRFAGRNPHFNLPPARQSIAADGGAAEVFRISPDEPWRIIRTRWRIGGVVKGAVEGGGRVSGYFTGATGTTIYRGDAYGDDFVNNAFTGDAGGQLVHRKKLHEAGVSLIGRRPDDEQGFEFAASTDTWVRVVNFANAPDGCLHVCDMYREVIEHPWSIPEEIKRHLDLNSGHERGRIYRIVPDAPAERRRGPVRLGAANTAELVETLEHANGWHRDTATRLLYERQDKTAIEPVRTLLRESKSALARHHALGVLQGLGALDDAAVTVALGDVDAHVRERALWAGDGLLARGVVATPLKERLAMLVDDPAPRVRMQLAFVLQTAVEANGPQAVKSDPTLMDALVRLARRDFSDTWISAALLSGRPMIASEVLFPAFARGDARQPELVPFIAKLIELRAAANPVEGFGSLIDFLARPGTRAEWIRALGDGLRRAGTTIEAADNENKLASVFQRAAVAANDRKGATMERVAAIELLGVAPLGETKETLVACLERGQPDAVAIAALGALAPHSVSDINAAIIRGWAGYSPAVKNRVIAHLVVRDERAMALLEAVKAGAIKPGDLPVAQVQSLVAHKSPAVAALAKETLASVLPPSRAEVVAKFLPAIVARGDAAKGQTHYARRCMMCHRAAGQGMELGPDLITVKTKGREALLTAILEPHKEVAPHYIAYDVATKDGNTFTGIIARDDATSLTLKIMGGTEITVPRANVRASSSSGKSVMPEGLEGGLSVQDMADLLSFIEELK